MQLREHLPYDVREVMRSLPHSGNVRDAVRKFTLNPLIEGRARSVRDLAERLGFAVQEVTLPRGMNGRIVSDTWAEAGFRIEVNQELSVKAKRFAVLHELGHAFRHMNGSDPFEEARHFDPSGKTFYYTETEEREANEFAEALLFGDGQLAAAVSLFGRNWPTLSRYFGVNEKVIQIAVTKLER